MPPRRPRGEIVQPDTGTAMLRRATRLLLVASAPAQLVVESPGRRRHGHASPRAKNTPVQPLIHQVAATLDGFIAAPYGDVSDLPADDDLIGHVLASRHRYAATGMGRHTWEIGVRHGHTNPYPFLDIDKLLVSGTVDTSPDPAFRVTAEPIPGIERMKRQLDGPIWLCGGSQVAGHLLAAGLMDLVTI